VEKENGETYETDDSDGFGNPIDGVGLHSGEYLPCDFETFNNVYII